MNWLDIVIAVILVLGLLFGLIVGLVRTLLYLIGTVVGIWLAGRYYSAIAEHLGFLKGAADVFAYLLIFLAIVFAVIILAWLLDKLISLIKLGWLNRLIGAILGLLLGALFCGAILAVWVKYAGGSTIVGNSILGTFLVGRFPLVLALLPPEFGTIRQFFP